jgi:hypothetical protein
MFLEKLGWQNGFYDGESRDIVDETIRNIEIYNRRLVMGETTMTDEIEKKFRNVGISNILEDGLTEDEYHNDNPMADNTIIDAEDKYEEAFREDLNYE